jgi:purine-cytosine permease-like protein
VSAFIGALVLVVTGFGIGWVNSAADYSRYLPRRVSTSGVIGWPTFGASLPVGVLIVYGIFLSASDPKLSQQIGADPIGALTNILPTWFLIPFVVVAVAGLVAGAVVVNYSSGLTLLAIGLPTPRWVAAAIDGVLMIIGAIYIVFFAGSFLPIFQAFLITLGVPIAAWCGVFLGDLVVRRRDYEEPKLFDSRLPGSYRLVRWDSLLVMVLATGLGWGLVIDTLNATPLLDWLGYLLGPFGLGGRGGAWAYAGLGILVALVVGFVAYLPFGRRTVRQQEAEPAQVAAA